MRPSESFIEQPIRSLQTMLRVIAQDDPQYPTIVPDGIYGPGTMQTVSVFQRKNQLPATGITDQATWETIVEKYEDARIRIDKPLPIQIHMDAGQIYRSGDSSPYIYLLQSMLGALSLRDPSITDPGHSGFMDDITVTALSSFQRIAGLPVTGEFDKITWKHLVHHFSAAAHHSLARRKNE